MAKITTYYKGDVAEVLAGWPQTIPVFTRHRMACVGCPIAAFETLAEVTAIYHLDLSCFLAELNDAIDGTAKLPQTGHRSAGRG